MYSTIKDQEAKISLAFSNEMKYNIIRTSKNYCHICPRGVTDNTSDSGSENVGSIPAEGAIKSKTTQKRQRF